MAALTPDPTTPAHRDKRAQRAALLVGVVFLLVGIAGFVPGITSHYDGLEAYGRGSMALLLGLFAVSVLHNLVHLAFGLAGLVLSRSTTWATYYLVGGGTVYLLLTLYGLVVPQMHPMNIVPLNSADDFLHAFLGVAMIGLGYYLSRGPRYVVVPKSELGQRTPD